MALFREVNERTAGFGQDAPGRLQEFICECSHLGCAAHVLLPLADYAVVREEATTFLVIPGHEEPAYEDVVVRRPRYLIVRGRAGVAALERAFEVHTRAAAMHKCAADFHEEHAAGEHRFGNESKARQMEQRADREREREQHEQELADDARRRLDRADDAPLLPT